MIHAQSSKPKLVKVKKKKNYDQREKVNTVVVKVAVEDLENEEYCDPSLKTKFGYRKQFATVPKPQKIPHEELMRKYKLYEVRVREAIKQQKIFRIISAYDVPTVREELYKRGWVETVLHPWQSEYHKMSDTLLLEKAAAGNAFEHVLLSRITGERTPTFVWLTANQLYTTYGKTLLLSKINIREINFGAKDGLCRYAELLRHDEKRKRELRINHPRVYNVNEPEGLREFWRDFYVTAAASLIIFLDEQENLYEMFSCYTGTVDMKVLEIAFQGIIRRMKELSGLVYREKTVEEVAQEEEEWKKLLEAHRKIIIEGQRFLVENDDMNVLINDYVCQISILAGKIRKHWAIRRHDGVRNIWLMKPTNSSQGQGIVLCNEKEKIEKHLMGKTKFVMQKYIETPLLVYNTKFDIRHYFLVTVDHTHIRCWTHSCCSVKLASAEFTLDTLNESIHITNAAVQQKYRFKSNHNLPSHHMWSLGTLILYMEQTSGNGHMWNEKVYPTMVRTIQSLFIMSLVSFTCSYIYISKKSLSIHLDKINVDARIHLQCLK